VLIECGRRLPADWLGNLKAAWKVLTGSKYINIERMYGLTANGRNKRGVNRRALRELVKYSTKAAEFSCEPQRVGEFLDAFKDVRRMQSFGSFKGMVKEAKKEADAEENPRSWEPIGCKCGLCTWGMLTWSREPVHISQTILFSDGTRQLRLFDSGADPPLERYVERQPENNSLAAFTSEANLFTPQLRLPVA
jgi:hypothetical protein